MMKPFLDNFLIFSEILETPIDLDSFLYLYKIILN